jgi:hypothetical protein
VPNWSVYKPLRRLIRLTYFSARTRETAFFLRSSSDGEASIYIRINECRGDQFKLATGHAVLRSDHWSKTIAVTTVIQTMAASCPMNK